MKTSDRIPPRSSVPPLEASDQPRREPEAPPAPEPPEPPAPSEEPQQPEPEAPPPEEQPPAGEGEIVRASYVWDDIANAPRDMSEIIVRYEGETEGRLVRWKHGRRFNGRKWIDGGRWVPVDSLQPLPVVEPTHWARPAGYGEPPLEETPAIEVTAEGVGYETPPKVEAA